MLELDSIRDFAAATNATPADDFFAALPAHPAVCLIELRDAAAEPLLIRTQNLRRRLQRLLGHPDLASKRLNLSSLALRVRYRLTASPFEQTLAYYQNAKRLFPLRYRKLLRLRSPALLKVNLRNPYPRCFVTRRIPANALGQPSAGSYYGPFASRRSAAAFANRAADFFKVRRCQIKIRRDPSFPGCIYSEMKMCLAPCFAGCSKEDYDVEVHRLVEFLDTGGQSLRTAFEQERQRASDDQDFERAASVHKKIHKLEDALRAKPHVVRRILDLDAVILQRSFEDQAIGVFPVRAGRLAEPFFLRFASMASQPLSAEQLLRDHLEPRSAVAAAIPERPIAADRAPLPPETIDLRAPPNLAELPDLGEHLSLIARWYYANPREGELFFKEKCWPYRRILRACSRLLAPKSPEPQGDQQEPFPAPASPEALEPNEGDS